MRIPRDAFRYLLRGSQAQKLKCQHGLIPVSGFQAKDQAINT